MQSLHTLFRICAIAVTAVGVASSLLGLAVAAASIAPGGLQQHPPQQVLAAVAGWRCLWLCNSCVVHSCSRSVPPTGNGGLLVPCAVADQGLKLHAHFLYACPVFAYSRHLCWQLEVGSGCQEGVGVVLWSLQLHSHPSQHGVIQVALPGSVAC